MSLPLTTVLIDTYNYGQYIEQAVESVLAQDFSAEQREILIVDDGSTDDTAQRLRKYNSQIQYFRKENGGQASALNFGLARARGEIVALLDADDYWLPGKLQRVAGEFQKHPEAGMVYHTLRQLKEKDGTLHDGGLPLLSGFVSRNTHDLLNYVLYPTSFLAFRRKILEPLLPIPEGLRIQADAHLSALIIFLAPIVGIPEPLAVYRVHASNLFSDRAEFSKRGCELRVATRQILIDEMKRWLAGQGYDLSRPDLHAFFKQWELKQEADEFTLAPPGRMKICRHLLEYARFYGPQLTPRHRAVTYFNALGSLVLGYRNYPRLDEWRLALKGGLGRRAPKGT
jgi:glycosyltransferase involved in cell wall biosynthesis